MSGPSTDSQPQDRSAPAVSPLGGHGSVAAQSRAARWVLTGAFGLVALVHLALAPGPRALAWPFGYMLLEALATASLAFRAWRTHGQERQAWGLLAASTSLEVPNLLLDFFQLRGQLLPWITDVRTLLSLGTGILVVLGVLRFPLGKGWGGVFRRRLLDGLIFAASVFFLLWAMGVHGSLRAAAQGVGLRVLVSYLNAALLGGSLVFMTSYHPDRLRGPLGWLGASALAWLAALFGWALAGLPAVVASERWILLAGAIPLFQGLAAWSPVSVEGDLIEGTPVPKFARALPYLPVLGAILVLAALLPRAPLDVMRGAMGIFLGMVALLLVRQFQDIQDLRAARRTLEDRVQQRTRALEQAQDTLLRTERMNTVALMGAGLAHDLNNLLCAMKSSAELAAMNIEEGQPPLPTDLLRIASTADRAALLTRRLMGFVRHEAEELAPTDLGQEARDIEATLRLLLPRAVELRIEAPTAGALLVQSSKLRLEQMLVNLVANARDAMPQGGSLTVRVDRDDRQGVALLEVADTGTGMSPDILAQIFDPFFTTKAPGRGTGLGLPSLKAMVDDSGGRLEVASEVGRGTRFRIFLPLIQSPTG